MKHLPEPWYIDANRIVGLGRIPIVESFGSLSDEEQLASNGRIISCVNALVGLEPEAIKGLVDIAREIKENPLSFQVNSDSWKYLCNVLEKLTQNPES